jgi:hypothetical protein
MCNIHDKISKSVPNHFVSEVVRIILLFFFMCPTVDFTTPICQETFTGQNRLSKVKNIFLILGILLGT